jgi:hypothetical protein
MKPGEAAVRFSILYLFACSARWSPTGGCSHDARDPDESPPPPAQPRRIMAWLLGAFVVLLFFITIAKMSGVNQ